DERPHDEEFLLAALLHDVGKAIDPSGHVTAALQALEGAITKRTAWLIEPHGNPGLSRRDPRTSCPDSPPGVRVLRRPATPPRTRSPGPGAGCFCLRAG